MHNAAVHIGQYVALDAPVAVIEKDSANSAHIENVSLRRLYRRRKSVHEYSPRLMVCGHSFRIA
jgi:hypothetical protein